MQLFDLNVVFSFGTWTTSPPWWRGEGSVMLTICGHCVLCVIETSPPNKTKTVPNRSSASWRPNVATLQRSFQCSDSVSLTDTVCLAGMTAACHRGTK